MESSHARNVNWPFATFWLSYLSIMLLLSWFVAVMLPAVSIAAPRQVQVVELKPNLQALPAGNLAIVQDMSGAPQLVFSATTWNNGDGPLVLVAGETDPATLKQKVYQRVFLSDGTFYNRVAGDFVWHPSHNHFHFEDYAIYTLQPFNAPGASARTSAKTSFCVMTKWEEYRRENEQSVCDSCMFADPKYVERYGSCF